MPEDRLGHECSRMMESREDGIDDVQSELKQITAINSGRESEWIFFSYTATKTSQTQMQGAGWGCESADRF